jgi:signal transduction histidine kinase
VEGLREAGCELDAPLKMIKEGLKHTRTVYAGVREFTNLVKPGAVLPLSECDLAEILTEYLSSTAYRKQVVIGILPTLMVNSPLFCTAIDNLIRNGLKYNDSPTRMVKVRKAGSRHIAVVDNGRGMTEGEFEEYSKPYTRKADQVETGTGLGLNICIAILREHGFSVTCQKVYPTGTMIRIRHD